MTDPITPDEYFIILCWLISTVALQNKEIKP